MRGIATICFIKIVFFIFLFTSCIKDDFSLGSQYLNSNIRIVITDTCKFNLSTVQVDSFVTSGLGVAWVGRINDKYFGNISASGYFSFSLPSFNIYETAKFDSLTLVIKNNSDYYGDTTNYHKIDVYRLTEQIALNSDGYLYSNSIVPLEQAPIAEFNFKPRPKLGWKFETRLPDSMGIHFFNSFVNKTDSVSTLNDFKSYFKGIALVPGNSENSLINSFLVSDSTVTLQLHYHYNIFGKTDNIVSILASPSLQFNHIDQDKNGTPIKNLQHNNSQLNSVYTENMSFIQGITGISSVLELPYLGNIQMLGQAVSVNAAVLNIMPISGSYGNTSPLPDSLSMSIIDAYNNLISAYKLNLNKNVTINGINPLYSADITSIMRNQLGVINSKKLFVKLGYINNKKFALKRLVFGNGQNLNDQAKIELKLMIYGTYQN